MRPHLFFRSAAFILSLSLAVIGSGAARAQCIEYDRSLAWTGMSEFFMQGPHGVDLAMNGTVGVVADGWSGLYLMDFSHSGGPAVLARAETSDAYSYAVAAGAGFAYLIQQSENGGSMRIYGISDPYNPVLVNTVPLSARRVCLVGQRLYAAGGHTLYIFDLSIPNAPALLGSFTGQSIQDLAVEGSYAYTADGTSGLRVIDVSNPAQPHEVGVLSGNATLVAVRGSIAAVGAGADVRLVDVSIPSLPVLISTYTETGQVNELDLTDSRLFMAMGDWGPGVLVAVDISDPAHPYRSGELETSAAVRAVEISGPKAFAVGATLIPNEFDQNIAATADVTWPVTPLTGTLYTSQYAVDVAASGNLVFQVCESSGRFYALDASDPANPVIRGQAALSCGGALQVEAAGDYVFTTNDCTGLRIFDVSDPSLPEAIGYLGEAKGRLDLEGSRAYTLNSVLRVVDVSVPSQPLLTGSVALPQTGDGLDVVGTFAYVGCGARFIVINVSNPAAPFIVANLPTPTLTGRVTAVGHYAYVSHLYQDGCFVIDISNPAAPVIAGDFAVLGGGILTTVDGVAYLAGDALRAVDITDPLNPVELGTVDVPGQVTSAVAANGFLHLGNFDWGYQSILPQCPTGASSVPVAEPAAAGLRVVPNPVRAGCVFENLSRTGGRVEIFGADGRLVRILARDAGRAGAGRIAWDGRDGSGVRVPAGVYWAREAGGSGSRRIVLIHTN